MKSKLIESKPTKAIAVIPARGGSKRIPKKNIIDFCGKPMIAWTIEAALKSHCFERVLVSTDSEEIATVAKQYGADVPFLRTANADDITPVSEATLSAVLQAEDFWQENYSVVTQLMANCPLRSAHSIMTALDNFQKSDSQFSISAFKFGWMNPWWAVTLDAAGKPTPLFPDALTRRSQDLEALYCPTGATWIATVAALKQSQTFYGEGYYFDPIPWTEAVDIDDAEDLLMAKSVAAMTLTTGQHNG